MLLLWKTQFQFLASTWDGTQPPHGTPVLEGIWCHLLASAVTHTYLHKHIHMHMNKICKVCETNHISITWSGVHRRRSCKPPFSAFASTLSQSSSEFGVRANSISSIRQSTRHANSQAYPKPPKPGTVKMENHVGICKSLETTDAQPSLQNCAQPSVTAPAPLPRVPTTGLHALSEFFICTWILLEKYLQDYSPLAEK